MFLSSYTGCIMFSSCMCVGPYSILTILIIIKVSKCKEEKTFSKMMFSVQVCLQYLIMRNQQRAEKSRDKKESYLIMFSVQISVHQYLT